MVPSKRRARPNMANTKKTKPNAAAAARKAFRQSQVTLYKDAVNTFTAFQDTVMGFNPFGNIAQGVAGNQRTGDSIHAKTLHMNFRFNPTVVGRVMARVMIIASDVSGQIGTDQFGIDSPGQSTIFRDAGALTSDIDLSLVDLTRNDLLYEKKYEFASDVANGQQFAFELKYNFNRKLQYKPGLATLKYKTYYVIVVMYRDGTKGVGSLGGVGFKSTLTFNDQ